MISRQSRTIAFIVAAAMFMQLLDAVIISTALPDMAISFGVTPLEMSVGVTVYMLTTAIFIPVAGWLADRFGPRQIFFVALLVFTVASAWCGMAQNLGQFIAARALQGLGGALMIPVGRVIVLRTAQKSELIEAIAMITWPALIAPVIGPALGGFITTYFSWRWNFFINIPLGLAGLAAILLVIPPTDERNHRPMDWLGFFLSSLSLGSFLYGLETFIHPGANALFSSTLIAIGLVAGAIGIWHLRRAKTPLLDLGAFRQKTFAISNLQAGSYARLAISATPFLLPLMFQIGFGLDALQAGSLTIAYFVGNLGMKTLTTPILRKFGFRTVMFVNGVLSAVTVGLCAFLAPAMPYAMVVTILFVAGLTRSMQLTALNTIAFSDVEPVHRSSASTLSTMLQHVAMLLGVALAAACLNIAQAVRGDTALALGDFSFAFVVVGLLALLSAFLMLRLPADAGSEVTGHRVTAH